jgi:hypothetical protein
MLIIHLRLGRGNGNFSVTQTVISSLKSEFITFSTNFRHSYAGGKLKYTYIRLFFREVAYINDDVAGSIE